MHLDLDLRIRIKLCSKCKINADVLYRASIDSKQTWQFYCGKCLVKVKAMNTDYHYGGTWKKTKKP